MVQATANAAKREYLKRHLQLGPGCLEVVGSVHLPQLILEVRPPPDTLSLYGTVITLLYHCHFVTFSIFQ